MKYLYPHIILVTSYTLVYCCLSLSKIHIKIDIGEQGFNRTDKEICGKPCNADISTFF